MSYFSDCRTVLKLIASMSSDQIIPVTIHELLPGADIMYVEPLEL